MKLSDFFQQKETAESTHDWTLVSHDHNLAPIDALAEFLADRIVCCRCGKRTERYQAWKQRFSEGTPLSPEFHDSLSEGFIKPGFGLPNQEKKFPLDHLQGMVAQFLWYFLVLETSPEEIIKIASPGFSVTDHGADGFVIHRAPTGSLMFRLWEIKKCTGSSPISTAVNRAYKQLQDNGYEYLARLSNFDQELPDAELAEFYGKLPELWKQCSPEAAVGVAVATNNSGVQENCFAKFGEHFPNLTIPKRLRGMLSAINDFPSFCEKVQKAIWKGL